MGLAEAGQDIRALIAGNGLLCQSRQSSFIVKGNENGGLNFKWKSPRTSGLTFRNVCSYASYVHMDCKFWLRSKLNKFFLDLRVARRQENHDDRGFIWTDFFLSNQLVTIDGLQEVYTCKTSTNSASLR